MVDMIEVKYQMTMTLVMSHDGGPNGQEQLFPAFTVECLDVLIDVLIGVRFSYNCTEHLRKRL